MVNALAVDVEDGVLVYGLGIDVVHVRMDDLLVNIDMLFRLVVHDLVLDFLVGHFLDNDVVAVVV